MVAKYDVYSDHASKAMNILPNSENSCIKMCRSYSRKYNSFESLHEDIFMELRGYLQEALRISKADVREALNSYGTDVSSDKDCYIIKVKKSEKGSLGKRESRAVK